MTDTKYDLDTIQGVLRALADGHTLHSVDESGCACELSTEGNGVEFSRNAGMRRAVWEAYLPPHRVHTERSWKLAPAPIESMDAQELASELWGKYARVGKSSLPSEEAHWVHDSLVSIDRLQAQNEAELLSMLRALVKAKRAGEL